jgi:hypothetical protein
LTSLSNKSEKRTKRVTHTKLRTAARGKKSFPEDRTNNNRFFFHSFVKNKNAQKKQKAV